MFLENWNLESSNKPLIKALNFDEQNYLKKLLKNHMLSMLL